MFQDHTSLCDSVITLPDFYTLAGVRKGGEVVELSGEFFIRDVRTYSQNLHLSAFHPLTSK